ncbi:ABC transporter permease [Nitrospira sp. Kam-Ns4a]
MTETKTDAQPTEDIEPDVSLDGAGTLRCTGSWTIPHLAGVEARLAALLRGGGDSRGCVVTCEASGITAMDTGGAWLLRRTLEGLRAQGREVALRGLEPRFVELLEIVGRHAPADEPESAPVAPPLERLGRAAWSRVLQGPQALAFLGESTAVLIRQLLHPRRIRWAALFGSLERDGVKALPIIGLLVFLMGVVIAYQGAEQLKTFGANIFVVDLVGISLLREIAPMVTAILVAGRSGSAYTAQIGTMSVTEEVDALRALGLSPMELLVIPRLLALVIVMPLLTVYADAVGVFGGMLIASVELNVSFAEFIARFEEAVALRHFLIGIGKAPVFAAVIALVGCYQGFRIRGNVDSVGRHTTISVVQGIFLVIVIDAVFSVLLSWKSL